MEKGIGRKGKRKGGVERKERRKREKTEKGKKRMEIMPKSIDRKGRRTK